jgi:hypothetical protein
MADSPATIMNAPMSLLSQPIGNNKRNNRPIARIRNVKNVECKIWKPKIFYSEFFNESLEKLPLSKKIPHKKSYLNNLNDNQDFDHLRFLVFLIFLSYDFWRSNLTVQSLA